MTASGDAPWPPPAHGIIGAVSDRRAATPNRRSEARCSRAGRRVLGGVCGGLARATGLDPLVVRVAVVALTVAGGTGALLYVAGLADAPRGGHRPVAGPGRRQRPGHDPARSWPSAPSSWASSCCAGDGHLVQRRLRLAAAAGRRGAGRHLAPGRRRRPVVVAAGRSTACPAGGGRCADLRSRRAALARVALGRGPRRQRRRRLPGRQRRLLRRPPGRAGQRRHRRRAGPDHRPVLGADGPRPGRGAPGAHPLRGAGRHGRPPARLRAPDPGPHPAQRRRPPGRRHHGPPPGAGAAGLAVPRTRPGRGRGADHPGRRPRPGRRGGRGTTTG